VTYCVSKSSDTANLYLSSVNPLAGNGSAVLYLTCLSAKLECSPPGHANTAAAGDSGEREGGEFTPGRGKRRGLSENPAKRPIGKGNERLGTKAFAYMLWR